MPRDARVTAIRNTERATRAAVDDALQVALVDDLSTEGARGFHREPWPGGALRPRLRWDSSFDPGP